MKDESAVVRRLDLIIFLLIAILAVLLWPVLPDLLFVVGLVLFGGLLAVFVWGMIRS